MLYSTILHLLALVTHVSAVPATPGTDVVVPRLCGSVDPPAHLQVAIDDNDARVAAATSPLVVNLFAHVITSTAKKGRYTRQQIRQQVAVMNKAYGPYGITFTLKSVDFTVNDAFATMSDAPTDVTYKGLLRKGTYADLNLYFLSDLAAGTGLLGYCLFPTNATNGSVDFQRDGCVVQADSIPGGSLTNYNMGGTATHEVSVVIPTTRNSPGTFGCSLWWKARQAYGSILGLGQLLDSAE